MKLFILFAVLIPVLGLWPNTGLSDDAVIPEDPESGFIKAENWETVNEFCTECHSSKVILQTRVSRSRWEELLEVMQDTHGMDELGEDEEVVLEYLSASYGPLGSRKEIYPKDESGLYMGNGWTIVKGTCSPCHSLKLVMQNRGDRDTWKERIVWMQKTQGLWDLGPLEGRILDYLAEFYGVDSTGRRPGMPFSLQPSISPIQ